MLACNPNILVTYVCVYKTTYCFIIEDIIPFIDLFEEFVLLSNIIKNPKEEFES